MEMEREYFEKFIESQFENVHSKLDTQIQLQKVANGRTSKLEVEVGELKTWRATSQGHWGAVNKILFIIGSLLGVVLTVIATYLWH